MLYINILTLILHYNITHVILQFHCYYESGKTEGEGQGDRFNRFGHYRLAKTQLNDEQQDQY